jgi:hypothetical protein
MLLEHRVLLNHARLVDMADMNPTMLAGPVALWLLYAALAGSRIWIQAAAAGLLVLISPKVAAMPVLIAVMLLWKDRFAMVWRWVGALAGIGAVGAGILWSQAQLGHAGAHAELFRWIVLIDGPENNPFADSLLNNAIFAGLCAGVFALRGLPPVLLRRVRAVAGLGLFVWLGGGLYLSFSPERLQSPHLALIGVARSLWWVQYVVYLAYGAWALKEIQRASTWARLASALALLMWLTLLHMFFRGKTAVAIAAGMAGAALWYIMRTRRQAAARPAAAAWRASYWPGGIRVRIVALSLALATLSTYALGTVNHRRHDLAHLMRYGIMGGNPGAKWRGINEYFRAHTPASATVLALSMEGHPWSPRSLRFDGWLRCRSGRTMPFGPKYSFVLDRDGMLWHEARIRETDRLVERWTGHDAAGVTESLAALDAPDYLVVPNEQAGWIRDGTLPYAVAATVRDFTIMEKRNP